MVKALLNTYRFETAFRPVRKQFGLIRLLLQKRSNWNFNHFRRKKKCARLKSNLLQHIEDDDYDDDDEEDCCEYNSSATLNSLNSSGLALKMHQQRPNNLTTTSTTSTTAFDSSRPPILLHPPTMSILQLTSSPNRASSINAPRSNFLYSKPATPNTTVNKSWKMSIGISI